MIEAIKLWNEPNNLSHWDFQLDPEWRTFTAMTRAAADAVRARRPDLTLVLGGISPIDPGFIRLVRAQGLLEHVDVLGVHGFPLDWNHWMIDEWPDKIASAEAASGLPVWVTECGASSFGAHEVQAFGLRRTAELLRGRVARVFWYSLLDLPPTWEATTRHKESEGSSYYRHYHMGLLDAEGSPKPAAMAFPEGLGICQWFHFEDPRLELAVDWLRRLGVTHLRTGLSWADRHRPGALDWFDRQMALLEGFTVTLTLCFTPGSRGVRDHHTSPPLVVEEFAEFAVEMVERYAHPTRTAAAVS